MIYCFDEEVRYNIQLYFVDNMAGTLQVRRGGTGTGSKGGRAYRKSEAGGRTAGGRDAARRGLLCSA